MQLKSCLSVVLLVLVLFDSLSGANGNEDIEFERKRLIRTPPDGQAQATPQPPPPQPPKPIPVPAPPGELYIPASYNKYEIPKMRSLDGKILPIPTKVTVHLNIRQILGVNEADEELMLEMDMHVEWGDASLLHATLTYVPGGAAPAPTSPLSDPNSTSSSSPPPLTQPKFFLGDRFRNPKITILDPVFLKKIWKPDIFIENLLEVEQPDLMGKPAKLRWSSRGNMAYTARVKARIKCHFDFAFYPADTQACDFTLRSYSHNQTALKLAWRPPTGVYLLNPYDDNYDLAVGDMRRFRHVVQLDPNEKTNAKGQHDSFDALRFTIYIRRLLSYHIMQTYVPSMLYIAITWLCFMVPKGMIEGRMAIVMTTLLTLTAMFASVRESTPVVSYTKAIDRWMVACIAFVFMVLLEFSLLLWTESNREELELEEADNNVNADGDTEPNKIPLMESKQNTQPPEVAVAGPKKEHRGSVQRLRRLTLHLARITITFIEDYSFILILMLLLTFNLLYWSWLMFSSGYWDWHVNATHNAVAILQVDANGGNLEQEIAEELPVFA